MAIELITQLVYLVVALIVLGASAKYAIESASRLSRYFGISELAIGFILVSLLTSLPELSVAVVSATSGQNNLSFGDLTGSNVTNIALILGTSALIKSSKRFDRRSTESMIIFLALSVIPFFLVIDGQLTLVDAVLLFVMYAIFLQQIISRGGFQGNNDASISRKEAAKQFLILLAGIGIVIVSAGFVVENAVRIAQSAGIFQSFIGATIVALGTSVPELAISIAAARKEKWGLAVGNIVGSNVTNLTLILAINAGIRPFDPNLVMGSLIAGFIILSSAFLGYMLWRNGRLGKVEGVVLIIIYLWYLLVMSGAQVAAMG
jgi:cation:H+ antiporter